jgi:hypothetical protein
VSSIISRYRRDLEERKIVFISKEDGMKVLNRTGKHRYGAYLEAGLFCDLSASCQGCDKTNACDYLSLLRHYKHVVGHPFLFAKSADGLPSRSGDWSLALKNRAVMAFRNDFLIQPQK